MLRLHKRFGATAALSGVDLLVQPAEVHALLGENGAGKSTLMKILAGVIRPDAGEIQLDAAPFAPRNPLAARRGGVAMIYQELNLALHLTVAQNLTLGIERHAAGIIRRGTQRRRALEILNQLGQSDLPLDLPVVRLSPARRQMVEIARALMTDARVIVMDEPTSSLGAADIERLFAVIDALRAAGLSIIYISHFLEEARRVADRFTVLRDGRSLATGAMRDISIAQLVEHMIGRRLDDFFPSVPHTPGDAILRIQNLAGRRLPVRADLELRRGEVLGLAGLVGAGRTELLRAIFGLDAVRHGDVRVAAYSGGKSPADRLIQGVGLLSEDRAGEGLALARSVADNALLSRLGPLARLGWIRPRAVRRAAQHWIEQLGIRTRGPQQAVRELSGGNQQKVALARLLHHDVEVLLLDEPTRGVDVGSKAQIYALIGQLAARGKAVLIASSYLPELLGVCDRIAVMHRGRLGPARPVSEWNEHSLMLAATRGDPTSGASR
ncbi:Ribose import ATP-binding protein RbsA [Phycisphaerae bacterium RAS1]|nr:Ribose import ATP-binding protein RbsA [Phycisphaerae bacterium RAS1]